MTAGRRLLSWLAVALLSVPAGGAGISPATATPEQVLRRYLGAIYSHDYDLAYELISPRDRAVQTREQYVRARGAFAGAALELARALASVIRYEDLRTSVEGDRAVVTFRAILPDAGDRGLQDLVMGFDAGRLAARSAHERRVAVERLRERARDGRMPVVTGEGEQWELVRQNGRWWVALDWANAVVVRFTGGVRAGLPWRFGPDEDTVRAMPGETLRIAYRATNLSAATTTGKARHRMWPSETRGDLRILQCFCLIEQTLGPGETQEMPVFFMVSPRISAAVREIGVDYQFYPADRFPGHPH